MSIYTGNNYRKIYESHFGPIPKDDQERSYEIHHIDGNRKNNDPSNLQCLTIQEHYNIHFNQSDWGACYLIARKMKLSPEELSTLSKKVNQQRIQTGEHQFCGDKNPQKQEHNRIKSSKKMKAQYETVWKNNPENKKMRSLWGKKGSEFMKSTEGRLLASSKTQSKNPNYDHTILTFEHTETNTQFTGTMYDFRTKFMLRQSSVSMVVAGKRQKVSGWKLVI
jgi:hypothetical protein